VSLRVEVQNITELLKSYGYSMPELEFLDAPRTLEMLMHAITRGVLRNVPEFVTVIADIKVIEFIKRLSGMDASEKLIDIGTSSYAREAREKLRREKKHVNPI